jgi:protease-4
VWRGLDGLRRVLHLLFLLLVFGFIVGALRGTMPNIPAQAVLMIEPQGQIVEQLSGDPIKRAFDEAAGREQSQTLLWDITDSIRAAVKDQRIAAIALQVDRMSGAGQPALAEIAKALQQFQATGRKVIVWANGYDQSQYLLAAQADEIYLDPFGAVMLEGYARYRMYYKGLLDKLNVDMHLFRVGVWKSAAEDMVRTGMSPEDRTETEVYLNALWKGYRETVASARGLEPQAIDDYANGYIAALRANKGDAASVALKAGLVTALKTDAQATERMNELVGAGSARHNTVTLADYTRVLRAEQRMRSKSGAGVAVVLASGEILDGPQPPGSVGGETLSALLRQVREDKNAAAIVLRVDSPGGSVFASEQIYREVLALKAAGKPVVVSMGSVAASGGYYIAAPADRILADARTITGSIGIFALLPTIDRTLNSVGVTVDGTGTTALSGKLRIDRPMNPVFQDYIQLNIERGYEQFIDHVAQGRSKSRDEVHEVAQGRVWVGEDALARGLVDELGGYADAVKIAAELAKLPEGYAVRRVDQTQGWAEALAQRLRISFAHFAGGVIGPSLQPMRAVVEPLQAEMERVRNLTQARGGLAYCFCGVE